MSHAPHKNIVMVGKHLMKKLQKNSPEGVCNTILEFTLVYRFY